MKDKCQEFLDKINEKEEEIKRLKEKLANFEKIEALFKAMKK